MKEVEQKSKKQQELVIMAEIICVAVAFS